MKKATGDILDKGECTARMITALIRKWSYNGALLSLAFISVNIIQIWPSLFEI